MAEMTKEQLAELDRLEREATPGKARVHQFAPDAVAIGKGKLQRAFILHATGQRNLRQCLADAAYFAALANAARPLLDTLDSQAAEIQCWRGHYDRVWESHREQKVTLEAQAAEIERLNKRVAELANRCLDVRDQVNKYHKSKLQSDIDELDRLVGECNKPDLIHDLEKIRDDLHADEVRKWREAFDRECESRRQAAAEIERLRKELLESNHYISDFQHATGCRTIEDAMNLGTENVQIRVTAANLHCENAKAEAELERLRAERTR